MDFADIVIRIDENLDQAGTQPDRIVHSVRSHGLHAEMIVA